MSYQRGDARVRAGSRELILRLTLGALAEICDRMETEEPTALARRLARTSPDDLLAITTSLLRPVHGTHAQGLALSVPSRTAAPAIARLFEEAFA